MMFLPFSSIISFLCTNLYCYHYIGKKLHAITIKLKYYVTYNSEYNIHCS